MSIEVKMISKRFQETQALDRVSVTFEENRIYGLLGNNGAGKSTLLHILTDRLPPDDGEVLVDGQRIHNNDQALGKLFLVGEQNLFPEDMRVHKAFQTAARFCPDFDRDYAMEAAKKFGLNQKKKITALSTGYASIFRLILGLSVNAPYLIFDEPVLGLDAQHRELFYRMLVEKYMEQSCTILISTHLIAEVANLIEHTVIIREGRILCNKPTEELTARTFSVSGPAGAVEQYLAGRRVLSIHSLGGLKTAAVEGDPEETLPAGLERSPLNLQDYFISLMEEEDQK